MDEMGMTGRPQREVPKETVRADITEDTYVSVLPLLRNDIVSFASVSQLVETIVFLSEHIYVAEPDDSFVVNLAKLKARRTIEQIRNPDLMKSRFIHVTLDVDAIGFLDLLVRKYPMLFRRRSDVLELLLLNVGSECDSPKGMRYYANRLSDVLLMHPTHRDRLHGTNGSR